MEDHDRTIKNFFNKIMDKVTLLEKEEFLNNNQDYNNFMNNISKLKDLCYQYNNKKNIQCLYLVKNIIQEIQLKINNLIDFTKGFLK